MSSADYYHMCQQGIGRAVHIQTKDGRVHRGIIERVSRDYVYLRPLGGGNRFGGYSYGYYGGYGWGGGYRWGGFATGLALGAIATLFFIPFFW